MRRKNNTDILTDKEQQDLNTLIERYKGVESKKINNGKVYSRYDFQSPIDAQIFKKAFDIYFGKDNTAEETTLETNADTEKERRAREALKAAGLEGKTAPAEYTPVLSGVPFGFGYSPDSLVLIESKYNKKPPKNIRENVEALAKQFNGYETSKDKWAYMFEDESYGVPFFRALQIYLNNEGTADEFNKKQKAIKAARNEPKTNKSEKEIDNLAREALKKIGLEDETAPKSKTVFGNNEPSIIQTKKETNVPNTPSTRIAVSIMRENAINDNILKLADELLGTHSTQASSEKTEYRIFDFPNEELDDIFTRAAEIYLNVNAERLFYKKEEGNQNESSELAESGSVADRHQDVQSEVRAGTDEETRQERRNSSTENISGQERQALRRPESADTGTNAESTRPVSENGTGSTSARTGAGNGVRGSEATVQPADSNTERGRNAADAGLSSDVAPVNFRITEDNTEIGSGGLKAKFQQNIAAIKLLKQLESEGRFATPEEQETLAQFNGWGTLAKAFTTTDGWQKEFEQLKEILTPEEYDAASKAITNAFYTPPEISRVIWQGLQRLGFKGGKILDPSMGTGIFFGTMPEEIANNSSLVGVELDDLTGRIARQLYQKAGVDIKGFQDSDIAKNFYDLAISNVPFNSGVTILSDPEYRPQQYKLHDFFFAKAVDSVRPGGLVAFITSPDTMANADSKKLRNAIAGKADLIAAFKLPNTTFDKNAGTKALADIVILQRRLNPSKPSEHAQEWLEEGSVKTDKGTEFAINKYFENHPENIIGKPVTSTHFYYSLDIDGKGVDVAKELSKLMAKLPENVYQPVQAQRQLTPQSEPKKNTNTMASNFSFVEEDGKIYQIQGKTRIKAGVLVEVPKGHWATIRSYLPLAKAVTNIMNAELSPATTDEKLADLRKTLSQNYDRFVKKHGYINSPKNQEILSSDPNYGRTAAIEIYSAEKIPKSKKIVETAKRAPIFTKRTMSPTQEPTTANSVEDALYTSLAWHGAIDFNYMQQLTGKTETELIQELGDMLFKNPATNAQELREEYLSGNVREKLAIAKEAAKTNPEFKRNVEALEKIQPRDLTENEITTFLGSTWIDDSYYEQFARRLNGGNTVSIRRREGKFLVIGNVNDVRNFSKWRVLDTNYTLYDFLENALNRRAMVSKTQGKVNPVKTAACNNKIKELNRLFDEWIWADEGRKKELLHHFNTNFNNSVARQYDGSHLSLPTVAPEVRKKLYPHQKSVIWRIMQGGNTLIAHCVGAGKSATRS